MEADGGQMRLAALDALELRAALERERSTRIAAETRLAETVHDIRSALAGIIGYAEMLAGEAELPLPPRQIARRIERIAMGLCDLGGEAAGGGTARSTGGRGASLRRLLAQCAETVEPLCRAKGLALRLELPDGATRVRRPVAVRRIVHNLLTNAVCYTERGEIRLRGAARARHVELEVTDTGIGIAAASLGSIFERHARLDDARRLAPRGKGLGLAAVAQLCDHLGGRIEVDSTPGRGSAFRVLLPAPHRRQAPPEQPALFPAPRP